MFWGVGSFSFSNHCTPQELNAIDVKKKRCQAIPGAGGGLRIRIEIRWLRKPLKVDVTPGRIENSMQMEISLAKTPNKVFLQRFALSIVSLKAALAGRH